ncbi:MAG: DUF4870 family protein [Gammaproteobacteria bacterium]
MENNEKVNLDHQGEKRWATVVYLLQAISFFVGISYIAAVIVNYLKLEEVKGTWIESHFRWQIKTFWYGLAMMIVGALTIQAVIGYVILIISVFWIVYRIAFGWNRLSQGKTVPLTGYF